jgi:magnesium-transporting ATPase (P-type)
MLTKQNFFTSRRGRLAPGMPRRSSERELIHAADDGKDAQPTSFFRPLRAVTKDKSADSPDKVQTAISEKLTRFAQVPASAIFDLEPGSSPDGFSADKASVAREKYGPNVYASERPPSTITLFYRACATPFNYILTALAILSIATGDKATFSVMIVMVVFASGLRYTVTCCGKTDTQPVLWTDSGRT